MIHGDILIRVMNIKIRRFVRQPQALRDGLIRRGRGGILRCKISFCTVRWKSFFFYPMAGLFFLVGELSYVSYVTFINTSIKFINRLESR